MGAVYGALLNGTSQLAVNRICTMAGLPPMPCRMFHTYKKIIVKCAMDEVEKHLQENVKIIFEEYKKLDIHPDENGILDIEVIYDGTWHTRGYHSTLGAGIVIEVRTGLVIDFIGYSKSCVHCNRKKKQVERGLISEDEKSKWQTSHEKKGECYTNYYGTSSGAMESDAAVELWGRSEVKRKMRYMVMLSDGDTDSWSKVNDSKPYGDGKIIVKEECINHVHKRLANKLKKLQQREIIYSKNIVESDNDMTNKQGNNGTETNEEESKLTVKMGGKGRLTSDIIDHMVVFYQKAIREAETVSEMKDLIMMSFYHLTSCDKYPQHQLCPKGKKLILFHATI